MTDHIDQVDATMALPGKEFKVRLDVKVVGRPGQFGGIEEVAVVPIRWIGGDRVPEGGVYSIRFSRLGAKAHDVSHSWWVRGDGRLEQS